MRLIRATAAATVVAAALVGTATAAAAADPPAVAASISVDTAHPAGRLPADFVGLSFEMRELGIGNLDAHKGNLAGMLRTLGPSNLRIAGNTLDRDTLWVPAGQQPPNPLPDWVKDVVTAADIQRLDTFLKSTGYRAEVGINVGRWDPVAGADQAAAMASILGKRLVATECGNEPDQWVGKGFKPTGYAYAAYKLDWEACAAVVANHRLAGPDTASPTSGWASSLVRDEPDLTMVTVHQYTMDPTGTAERLLSPATLTAQQNAATPNLAAAGAAHLPMRIDETNSAYGGGIDGVSNKQASALWALDYSLQMAQLGLAGLNFHGGLGVCNQPIWNGKWQLYTPMCAENTADQAAEVYHAMPIYYGLWMARQLGPGTFLPVTLQTGANATAYAVRGDDGHVRLAVINKDSVPLHLDLAVPSRDCRATASVLRMTASGLGADDTAVDGSTVDSSGRLRPGRPDLVRVKGGSASVDIAAGSAVVVSL